MGSSSGLVDWRGRPVNTKKHGGVRASIFIHALVLLSNAANIANILNLVSYLRNEMHMDVARASTMASNFFAALQMFSIPAAFLADSYIKRFYTVLIFGPIEILGYILLAVQAHVPSLHPPPCTPGQQATTCESVHGSNLSLLLLGLYLIPIGDGAARACLPALGGEQFDISDPVEQRQEASFFNWYTFAVSTGGFVGLVFVVWVENTKGWDLGFIVCALCVLLGMLIWIAGFPFYRNQLPSGSPITRVLQVLVAAFRKRKVELPENPSELKQINKDEAGALELLPRTEGFNCLDKAAVDTGKTGAWSLCSITQVEETKIIIRMVPIFLSAVLGYIPVPLILNFTVQQGNTMDTRLGAIHISPATLFVIPTVFQMVILIVYDRFIVPFLRRITGYVGGVTHLQRIGIGFLSATVATGIAALVETKRRKVAEENGLMDATTGIPMSVFWLTFQFFLLGIVDVTSFVGLLEFFYSEASMGMKSIGSSIFYCILGVSAWLGSLLIQLANRVTRHSDGTGGWLDGTNLNGGKLDRFYGLLAILELVSLFIYMFFAWRYVYRNDQKVVVDGDNKTSSEGAINAI
ncbi:Protein NRT1/ PTR FAMILY 4.3 [Dichanthelium oligosanthes]|uniref:Protein NRT1/ PTR FAMILY 4.3 n=1 Tax=Dichanthelium oligosanthes TaxID=888268 RepID=A0A1E5VFT8_9POAL|nr:Protein NRT1/ PTR FAMILY 4.3 [Dichanthelium oligosanthes]